MNEQKKLAKKKQEEKEAKKKQEEKEIKELEEKESKELEIKEKFGKIEKIRIAKLRESQNTEAMKWAKSRMKRYGLMVNEIREKEGELEKLKKRNILYHGAWDLKIHNMKVDLQNLKDTVEEADKKAERAKEVINAPWNNKYKIKRKIISEESELKKIEEEKGINKNVKKE